jgi:hypothetical protein
MAVRCKGDSWIMERVGEKQDFESELSRLGLRHEDFALNVRRGGIGGADRVWRSNYAIRVTDNVTGKRNIYWGGPGENWIAQFATDVANGMYRSPPIQGQVAFSGRQVSSARSPRPCLGRQRQADTEP